MKTNCRVIFVHRIEKWLNARGRNLIRWDEILEGGISKTATIMSWRGVDGGVAAAKAGNQVIMTPNTHCYLDYFQTQGRAPRTTRYRRLRAGS